MRGQFATSGSIRLLVLAMASAVFFCHPMKNRLYVSMLFAGLSAAFAFMGAAVNQEWVSIAMDVCVVAYLASLAVEEYRVGKEAAKRQWEAADDRKKRRRAGK